MCLFGKAKAPRQWPNQKRNTTPLIVHIWTPEESAATQPVSRPIINRYIAAVDADGVISTGHAALEVPGKLYLSLYPAEEIDRLSFRISANSQSNA
ncbi:hypothetical protein BK025_04335 [Sodalis sp. TME1]|nr:hypothetical protein BK025_04335 [Sodalis sp. TME1]